MEGQIAGTPERKDNKKEVHLQNALKPRSMKCIQSQSGDLLGHQVMAMWTRSRGRVIRRSSCHMFVHTPLRGATWFDVIPREEAKTDFRHIRQLRGVLTHFHSCLGGCVTLWPISSRRRDETTSWDAQQSSKKKSLEITHLVNYSQFTSRHRVAASCSGDNLCA